MLTLYYDESCILCTTNAISVQQKNPNQIRIVSVGDGLHELEIHGISRNYAMTYVCVFDDNSQNMYSGMDAIRLLFDSAKFKHAWVLKLPVIKHLSNKCYPILAKNRYRFPKWLIRMIYGKIVSQQSCSDGVCRIPPKQRLR